MYEEDATVLLPPDGTAARGKAEIRRGTEPLFALRPTAEIEVVGKAESDGLALTLAHWTLVGTEPDGSRAELTGRGSIVSRRRPDGSWRIVLDIPVRPE